MVRLSGDVVDRVIDGMDTHRAGRVLAESNRTDAANARRFVNQRGAIVRHCAQLGGWFVWNGQRWVADDTGEVMRLAKATASTIYAEAERCANDSERVALAKWAAQTQSRGKLADMVTVAATEDEVAVSSSDFDAHPHALNVANGTLFLAPSEIGPGFDGHDPTTLLTKMSPVEFDPTARCPRWNAFLERVLPDATVRRYVQKAVGYSLIGEIREHVLFLLLGPGANGKSVFLGMVQHILGDYAATAEPGLLLQHRHDQHPTGIADLRGTRFVSTTEPDPGRPLAEALVKSLTGGDRVKARRMRQDFFSFDPSWTIWMAANHRPEVRGTDDGIWRRIKTIPFDIRIPREEQDPELPAKLRGEESGILNWAIDGLGLYWQEGLGEPEAVSLAVSEYRTESDPLGLFLRERTRAGSTFSVGGGELFQAWRDWCEQAGERAGTQTSFGRKMTERGFERFRTNADRRYQGFRLLGSDE